MHCYFVLGGEPTVPVVYHVERVRQGRSFATRTVQAGQRGICIFTTTLSFTREGSGGKRTLQHAVPMPDVDPPDRNRVDAMGGIEGPFESYAIDTLNGKCDYSGQVAIDIAISFAFSKPSNPHPTDSKWIANMMHTFAFFPVSLPASVILIYLNDPLMSSHLSFPHLISISKQVSQQNPTQSVSAAGVEHEGPSPAQAGPTLT